MLLSCPFMRSCVVLSSFSFPPLLPFCSYRWALLLRESLRHLCDDLQGSSPWMVSTFGWSCPRLRAAGAGWTWSTGPPLAMTGTHTEWREQSVCFTADWQQVNWLNPLRYFSLETVSPQDASQFTIIDKDVQTDRWQADAHGNALGFMTKYCIILSMWSLVCLW